MHGAPSSRATIIEQPDRCKLAGLFCICAAAAAYLGCRPLGSGNGSGCRRGRVASADEPPRSVSPSCENGHTSRASSPGCRRQFDRSALRSQTVKSRFDDRRRLKSEGDDYASVRHCDIGRLRGRHIGIGGRAVRRRSRLDRSIKFQITGRQQRDLRPSRRRPRLGTRC